MLLKLIMRVLNWEGFLLVVEFCVVMLECDLDEEWLDEHGIEMGVMVTDLWR